MKLFRIYCSLGSRGHLTLDQAREIALGLACDHFPQGHTIIEATGRLQKNNAFVIEPTIIIEVLTIYTNEVTKVRQLAGRYKNLAFQKEVMITSTEIDADFV